MKKGLKALLAVVMVVFLTTGCYRYNGSMTINKDKSMEYSIIYALDTTVWGEYGDLGTDSDAAIAYEEAGFTVTEYEEDEWKGIKATKSFSNIDDISSAEEVVYSLSETESVDGNAKMFQKVTEDGKDVYKANFTFSTEEVEESDEDEYEEDDEDIEVTTDEDDDSSIDIDTDEMEDALEAYAESMDLKFEVTLPEEALENNATTVNGKTYTWDLKEAYTDSEEFNINFSFTIPSETSAVAKTSSSSDNTKMYIGIGAVVAIVIIVVALVLVKGKKKPAEPVAMVNQPVAPVSPVAPVTPVVPETPVTPVTPVAPVAPTTPVETPVAQPAPAVPEAPVAPVVPEAPVAPVQVTAPVEPSVPTDNNGQNM